MSGVLIWLLIINGIDHGWSQMKTSNTSIKELANAPAFHDNVLEYDDRYFAVGEERLSFQMILMRLWTGRFRVLWIRCTVQTECGYSLDMMPVYFVGGGAVVMRNFGRYQQANIHYVLDVKANVKGFETMSKIALRSGR